MSDNDRPLSTFKKNLTAGDFISRRKAKTIFNSANTEKALGTNYNGDIVFNSTGTTITNFRSYDLYKNTTLGNVLCIPSSTAVDCSNSTCNGPPYYNTYNSMYTERDGSYNFIDLFGQNGLCKIDTWLNTGAYIQPAPEAVHADTSGNLPPTPNINNNKGLLDCYKYPGKIYFT